jgi:hypothetical protein
MKKHFIKRTRRQQGKVNETLAKNLEEIGLIKIPLENRSLEEKSLGLSKATRFRQEETQQCVGWRKYFQDGYFIDVFPTFNEKLGLFSTGGTASVLVKVPSMKKGFRVAFEMYFYRMEGMVEKIVKVVQFLDGVLQNIPRDRKGKPMKLVRVGDGAYFRFVSNTNEDEYISLLDPELLELFPSEFQLEILEVFAYRNDYHDNKPPGVRSIREIKDTRTVKNPHEVVPVFP